MGLSSTDWTAIASGVLAFIGAIALIFNILLVRINAKAVASALQAAKAAEEGVRVARASSQVQTFMELIDRMEDTREARRAVRRFMLAKRPWQSLTQQELGSVDAVCRSFDLLGYFDRSRLIDRRFVPHFYAAPLIDLYDGYLKPYVEHFRHPDRRGPTHYWELVKLRDRMEAVKNTHPGLTGADDWPELSDEVAR